MVLETDPIKCFENEVLTLFRGDFHVLALAGFTQMTLSFYSISCIVYIYRMVTLKRMFATSNSRY